MAKLGGGAKQVDVSDIFIVAGIRTRCPVVIQEAEGMYPHKKRLSDNWSYFTAAGFKHLHDHKVFPGTVAIVGIGSGVEGIAAAKVFGGTFRNTLRRLVIIDVDEEVVGGARRNIKTNLPKRSRVTIQPLVGSFCEPLTERGMRADLIHANIPNLPAPHGADLSGGAEKGTFLRPELYEWYRPPDTYIRWALGAQYAYIHSAKDALTKQGAVITEVGGRVPLTLLAELFQENGFARVDEVLVGFKEQTEALMDFVGYHEFERAYKVAFDFYLYDQSCLALQEHCIEGNIAPLAGDELKNLLLPYRVSAGAAIELYHKGVGVGHTVHILKGSRYEHQE